MDNNIQKVSVRISSGTIMRLLLIGVLVVAVIKLRSLVLVILTAIVVASFVESIFQKINKFIKNRTVAVVLIYAVLIGGVFGMLSLFIPVFLDEISTLAKELVKYMPEGSFFATLQPDTITGAENVISNISHNGSLGEVITGTQKFVSTFSGGFLNIFSNAFDGLFNLVIIFIISFYLSIREKGIESFLQIIIPIKHEQYVIDLWQRTERKIGSWIGGQLLLGVAMGTLVYIGLSIIGVKYALIVGLLTIFLELIPFGLLLAVIPGVLFSYIDGGLTSSFLVFVMFVILGQIESYIISPLVVKNSTGVSPLVVIISVLIGAELAGFWGVILAVPVAVCLLEFLDDIEKEKLLARGT